jgi:hypothetical protein
MASLLLGFGSRPFLSLPGVSHGPAAGVCGDCHTAFCDISHTGKIGDLDRYRPIASIDSGALPSDLA